MWWRDVVIGLGGVGCLLTALALLAPWGSVIVGLAVVFRGARPRTGDAPAIRQPRCDERAHRRDDPTNANTTRRTGGAALTNCGRRHG
jgi:hypothetical protein